MESAYNNVADHGELSAPLVADVAAEGRASGDADARLDAVVVERALNAHRRQRSSHRIVLVRLWRQTKDRCNSHYAFTTLGPEPGN